MDKVKIALIGCGMISEFHAKAISELDDGVLVGVYDKCLERSKEFAIKHDIIAYETYNDLLNADVDLVAICTPSGLHVDFAVSLLENGKNVIIEKPVAITKEGCKKLLSVAKSNNKVCSGVSQFHYSKELLKAKEILDSGVLGKIFLCNLDMKYNRSKQYFANSWRGTFAMDGGGALMNQGIHGVDLIRFLNGNIKYVNAKVGTFVHDIEVEDTAVARVQFENGAIGTIHATTSVLPGYPRRMEFYGDQGTMVIIENTITYLNVPKKPELDVSIPEVKINSSSDPTNISYKEHKNQYQDVIKAIKTGAPLFYPLEEAVESVKTILAIYESSKEDKNVYLK